MTKEFSKETSHFHNNRKYKFSIIFNVNKIHKTHNKHTEKKTKTGSHKTRWFHYYRFEYYWIWCNFTVALTAIDIIFSLFLYRETRNLFSADRPTKNNHKFIKKILFIHNWTHHHNQYLYVMFVIRKPFPIGFPAHLIYVNCLVIQMFWKRKKKMFFCTKIHNFCGFFLFMFPLVHHQILFDHGIWRETLCVFFTSSMIDPSQQIQH